MAEAIAKHLRSDPSVVIASAGLETWEGRPAAEHAVRVLRERGIDLSAHRSHVLTQEMCDAATVIYGVTEFRAAGVIARFPSCAGNVRMLDEGADIPDPLGRDYATYVRTADQLTHAIMQRVGDLGVSF
jgi:protein-tyrosine phosphatase